jgi:plasmid stabilization system protein ParE
MPPTYRVILSPEAAADLEAIHAYISQDSPDNAAKMVGRILDGIAKLEVFPRHTVVERQSKKIKHPVRSLPVRPYIVYFRVLEEQKAVIILTVRHGARRRPRRFD